MCELSGLSSNHPVALTMSLGEFARHGGPDRSTRDGWGIEQENGPTQTRDISKEQVNPGPRTRFASGGVQSSARAAPEASSASMRSIAARAWPSIPSTRLIRALRTASSCEAALLQRCHVTILMNLCTESPPV